MLGQSQGGLQGGYVCLGVRGWCTLRGIYVGGVGGDVIGGDAEVGPAAKGLRAAKITLELLIVEGSSVIISVDVIVVGNVVPSRCLLALRTIPPKSLASCTCAIAI